MATKNAWTFDETTVALGLYFQLPFGQIHHRNPEVIRVAKLLGRTSSALAMKIGNLARFDSTMKARGVEGLAHGAAIEGEVWTKYANHLDLLAEDCESLLDEKVGEKVEKRPMACAEDENLTLPPGLEKEYLAKYRVNQTFFRRAVLSIYGNKCCVTGISDERLLMASHIKPWAKCESGDERTTPANGLCLNALYDKAFDRGLMTLDKDLRIVFSSSLKAALTNEIYQEFFLKYEGKKITQPHHHTPLETFLNYHREMIFEACV